MIICDLCNTGPYTVSGAKLHRGTGRCMRLKAERPIRERVQKRRMELFDRGKKPMTRVVTNAIRRRGGSDVCGLETAETGWILGDNNQDSEAVEEDWVWNWVKAYYRLCCSSGDGSDKFYDAISRLVRFGMDPTSEAVEMEINLIKLAVA